jgi:hypothetical protein
LGFILLSAAEAPQAPQHIHYPLPLTHLGATTLSGSAHLTCLLDFRDCYYTRSGLLDHVDNDAMLRMSIRDSGIVSGPAAHRGGVIVDPMCVNAARPSMRHDRGSDDRHQGTAMRRV